MQPKSIIVSARIDGQRLVCRADPTSGVEPAPTYAFYVFKNDVRVNARWYSDDSSFEYDTKGVPGYYRIVAFVKFADDTTEIVKSAPLFVNAMPVDADAFPQADPAAGAYLLKGKTWDFPCLYYPGADDALFVMMPSAVERSKIVLPAFNRWTWAAQGVFPGHTLCIGDPTLELDDEMCLGWCLGSRNDCAADQLVEFITKFAAAKGIPAEKIVFWGSSAGGFAALALASRVPGSTAVAINAQTDALAYDMAYQVGLVRKFCFDDQTEEQIRAQYAHRVDMRVQWADAGTSRAILVQNELDVHHYDVHFKPFWTALGGTVQHGISTAGVHKAWVYTNANGHGPESPDMAREIIGML